MRDGRADAAFAAWLTPRSRLFIFAAVALLAFYLGFVAFGVERSRQLVKNYGYYAIAGTSVWAALAWWRVRPALTASVAGMSRREWLQMAGVIGACTALALFTTPIDYKILYDEMVLQATASDMHIYREVSTVVRGYRVDGVFVPFDTYVDKRPPFYPFLVSLVHDLTGYREANAFAINVLLFPLILILVYILGRKLVGHVGALAATVALGMLSTLTHSATGAGMETLNLAMLLLVMLLAVLYLQQPDEKRLAALVLSTVLLAQSRYESSLFVLPVALVALAGWWRARRVVLPFAGMFAPALLIPYAVHNSYVSGTPPLWELRENVDARFGFQHLGPNLRHAYEYFFATADILTNSLWLSGAGFLALGYVLIRGWRARRQWRETADPVFVTAVFAVGIVGNLAILMFYYWGQLDDPAVARLALPFSVLLALAIGAVVQRWQPLRWVPRTAFVGAIVSYLATGLVANEQHSRRNTLLTEIEWESRFVESLPPGDRLIISNKSALPWILQHIPAISVERARVRGAEVSAVLADRTFREVLVSQTLRPTTENGDFRLIPSDRLPDSFVLETVVEKRFGARLNRISRVLEVKHDGHVR